MKAAIEKIAKKGMVGFQKTLFTKHSAGWIWSVAVVLLTLLV
jgi:hypothetical protein